MKLCHFNRSWILSEFCNKFTLHVKPNVASNEISHLCYKNMFHFPIIIFIKFYYKHTTISMGMTFIFSLYTFYLDPQSFVGQQGLAWFYLKYLI